MKVKLDENNLTDFFVVYECCNTKQIVVKQELMEYDEVTCCECKEPYMYRARNGNWYKVTEKII